MDLSPTACIPFWLVTERLKHQLHALGSNAVNYVSRGMCFRLRNQNVVKIDRAVRAGEVIIEALPTL